MLGRCLETELAWQEKAARSKERIAKQAESCSIGWS